MSRAAIYLTLCLLGLFLFCAFVIPKLIIWAIKFAIFVALGAVGVGSVVIMAIIIYLIYIASKSIK